MIKRRYEIPQKDRPVYSSVTLPPNARLFMLTFGERNAPERWSVRHLFFKEPGQFSSVSGALLWMERILAELDCTQPDTQRRSFFPQKKTRAQEKQEYLAWLNEEKPKPLSPCWEPQLFCHADRASEVFYIRVLYRQHSSWQGEIYWKQDQQKQYFRSVLELMLLIDSALQGPKAQKQQQNCAEKP